MQYKCNFRRPPKQIRIILTSAHKKPYLPSFFFYVCPVVRLHGHQVAWTGWRCGCPQRVRTAQSQGRIQATHFWGAQPVLDRLNVLLARRRLLRQSSPPGGPQGGAKIYIQQSVVFFFLDRGSLAYKRHPRPLRPPRTRGPGHFLGE